MARLRYEIRALGIGVFGLPLLAIITFVGFAALAAFEVRRTGGLDATAHADVAQGLLFLLEAGTPLVAGLAAAYLVANNPAKELHLALPTLYVVTMMQRLAIFLFWAMAVSAGASAAIAASGYWVAPQDAPRNLLIWLAPLLWLLTFGALLSLLLGNWIASSTILGLVWMGELLLRPYILPNTFLQKMYLFLTIFAPSASYWLANRLTLLGMAGAFLVLTAWLLRRSEALLSHES